MKKFNIIKPILLVLLGLFLSATSAGDAVSAKPVAEKPKQEKQAATKKIKVIARLVELEGSMAPNDLYNYVYIMKYKVSSVVEGSLKEKIIYVGHYNPLKPRKLIQDKMKAHVSGTLEKFVAGEKHELILSPGLENFWDGPVEDEYFDNTDIRYFALSTKKVP